MFRPNIVIDADVGCLWTVEINYEALCNMVSDRVRLTDFLLQRSKGKMYLIQVLQEMIAQGEYTPTNLPIIEAVFDRINGVYKAQSVEQQGQATGTGDAVGSSEARAEIKSAAPRCSRPDGRALAGVAGHQRPGALWQGDDGVPVLADQARHCGAERL